MKSNLIKILIKIIKNKIKKVIEKYRGELRANEYKINFIETSAKKNINVDFLFRSLAQLILQSKFYLI